MGKVGVEKCKRKKKKGRPSLLDLHKRSLKQQQQLLNKHRRNLLNTPQPTQTVKPDPSPNPGPTTSSSVRRSTRRNPNPNSNSNSNSNSDYDDNHNHNHQKKKKKKLKLVNHLPDDDFEDEKDSSGDDDSAPEVNLGGNATTHRKRKIGSLSPGSAAPIADIKVEKQSVVAVNQTITQQESKQDDGPTTPLPDKKLLLFILDRLQKKDTYGVFAEPVDPEELPDYFEVIDHPMDFGTVRKKLDDGAYVSLEQFERDVFLICSNAMQYNAPDTIYFRQARSILELAKKNFDNLRQDSDDNELDSEPKVVRRGRPPTKHLKRPPGRPPIDRANSDFSEGSLTAPKGTISRVNELRKSPSPLKYGSADSLVQSLYGSRNSEAYIGRPSERFERSDDLTGSASKGISLWQGKKKIMLEETRNTYKHPYALACGDEPSVLTTFRGERKQLIAVGLHTEYGYARSLARFTAKLGPVAWKVASRRIERCLPTGVKFGPGWVGESEAPTERPLQQLPEASSQSSAPVTVPAFTVPASADSSSAPIQSLVESSGDKSEQKSQGEQLSGTQMLAVQPNLDNESNKPVFLPSLVNNSIPISSACPSSNGSDAKSTTPEASTTFSPSSNMLSTSTGLVKSENSIQFNRQTSTTQPRINGTYGLNFAAQMGKIIGAGRPTMYNSQSNPSIVTVSRTESEGINPPSADNNGCGVAKASKTSSTLKSGGCLPDMGPHQKAGSTPDLNVGVQSPGSPVSGKTQPDLVLQL